MPTEEQQRQCICGHPFASHTRDIRESGNVRTVDEALLPPKPYDITTDRPAGQSGCTECECPHFKPVSSSAAQAPASRA